MEHIATIKLRPTFFAGSQPPIPAARKGKKKYQTIDYQRVCETTLCFPLQLVGMSIRLVSSLENSSFQG